MITKESFYKQLRQGDVAILCNNEEQWRYVYDTIVEKYPQYAEEQAYNYHTHYPWMCQWCGSLSGWTGEGTAHTRRYTYEEFIAIINQVMVPEDDVEWVGDLL